MTLWQFHPEAYAEFDAAIEHYGSIPDRRELAADFAQLLIDRIRAEVSAGVGRLPQFPRTSATYSKLARFPYLLIFHERPDDEEVDIVAIAHERRRPGYWRDRLDDGR